MVKHLDKSTDMVASNRRLFIALIINWLIIVVMAIFHKSIENSAFFLFFIFTLSILSAAFLFNEIINRI